MIDSRLDAAQRARIEQLGLDWRNAFAGLLDGKLVAFPRERAQAFGASALEPCGLASVQAPSEPLRALPAHRSELLSEIRGGEFLDVLGLEGDWALVQGEDGYVGWLARWTLHEQSAAERQLLLARWLGSFAAPRGTLWSSDHWASSPLELGTPLLVPDDDGIRERSGEWRVQLPWGAAGWISRLEIAAAPSGTREEVLRAATQLLGTSYRWGGRGASGLDCSGYTQACWQRAGVLLPRDAAQQMAVGSGISVDDPAQWQAGDLICFGAPADHVGLYDGRGALLHARGKVQRQPLAELATLRQRISAVRRPKFAAKPRASLWLRPPGERILPT
jgi:hypothetical protein